MLRRRTVAGFSRVTWLIQAGLLLAWPVAAQVRTGDVSSSLNGTVALGYTADYGNMTPSEHGWTLGGAANYSGSFYTPSFLSFDVGLYLNQSRANSNYQSISDASGVNATANIFSGSRFPGSVSYSKAFNKEGNYAVPGLSNYVTHGNSDAFGVSWSENLPNEPSLSAGFQFGSSKYSVYGTNDQGKNRFRSVNLHSGYDFADFDMGAYYSAGDGHSLIPQIVAGSAETETESGSTAYGFNVSHRLPMQGSISGNINRSTWDSNYLGFNTSGSIDIFNTVASVHPTEKLSLSASVDYSDNLSGQLIESVIATGGVVSGLNSNTTSNSLDLQGIASYAALPNLQTSAYVERRTQSFEGEDYGDTSYGGSAAYSHALFDGNFNAALNVTANNSDQSGEDTLGFSTTENYSNVIRGWHVNGSFGYAQNVQTLLITYMNSFYNFSGNVARRWGQFSVSAGANTSRTALTQQAGTTSSGEGYNASFGYGTWITATGSYSKSSGQALATGAGLVPVPIPSPTLPSDLVSLYGGTGYSFGLSSIPVTHLVMSASYSRSNSNTSIGSVASTNQDNEFNALIQYQVRKLNFTSGFSRLDQGFSQSGTQPEILSSFYIGVSRWFNFF